MIPSNRKDQSNDQLDELDCLLLARLSHSADPLTPSSGFAQSVMDAIHEQSSVPEPIPFPWKRILPFAIALLCILAAFIFASFVFAPAPQISGTLSNGAATLSFLPSLSSTMVISLGSIVSAIGLCLAITFFSLKLAAGRE